MPLHPSTPLRSGFANTGKAQQVGDGSCTQVLKVVMPVRQSFVAQQQPPSPPVAAFAEEKKKVVAFVVSFPETPNGA